jgi:hypothetical protein
MAQPSQLNINSNVVAFSDVGLTNNPLFKHFDWTRNLNGLMVYSPKAEQNLVPPRTMLNIFNGLRATTFDGTTSINVSNLVDTTYRLKLTAGTDPHFALDSPLNFTGASLTVAIYPNQTITLTANSAVFTGVASGSYLYIYSPTDNPSAAFSVLNSGVWTVLSNSANTILTLARPSGTPFQALAQTVTCNSALNVLSYVLSAVQVGDKVRIDAPFSMGSQATYAVANVTSKWVDVVSTTPLVPETVLASTTGLTFYYGGKQYLRVEVDQRAKVYFNGSTSQNEELAPWQAGDRKFMAWQERVGPVWSLDVYNLSTVPMVVNVFSCE